MIYTGTLEGGKILAVTDELPAPILSLKNNLDLRDAVNRNTKWIKLTCGLLYYTLSGTQLISMLEKYTKEEINFREYVEVVQDSNYYHQEIYIDGFSNI